MPGREASREIWLHRNVARAGLALGLDQARTPLLRDVTGRVSYLDPAWSPDGRYLAYVQTDAIGTTPALYVQEFAISDDIAEAVALVGSPILAVPGAPGATSRHPDWSPDGTVLAFGSTASGLSFDIYTARVFPSVEAPVRRTFEDFRAEQSPAWSPDGNRIAYMSNFYGPAVIAILDLTTPSPHAWTFAEPFALPVYHANPVWSSDGGAIYYHAPKNEDQDQLPDIWKLDLATLAKCAISIDLTADSEVDVSRYEHRTPEGVPFNYFLFTSMAGNPDFRGPNIWRGELVYNCLPPLPMGVKVQPNNTIKLGASSQPLTVTLSFPPETIAAGYQCASFDGPLEGVKLRRNVLASPTLEGLRAQPDPATGGVFPIFADKRRSGEQMIDVTWERSQVESILVVRGRLGSGVPLVVNAYSNVVGRAFRGFAYIKVTAPDAAAGALVMEQNAPNPFNPATTLHFATGSAGNVTVRIFNARGQLVRRLAQRWFAQGRHALHWDGRDDKGLDASSGIYYAQAMTESGTRERIKMVLMR